MEVLARRFRANMLSILSKYPVTASEFEPIVVPKHQSRGLSIEHLVISLYAKGMSVSDIEDELRDIYKINLSSTQYQSLLIKSLK